MAINYDFIAYCSKTSPTHWIIGMKALQGEVPLDIVIPDEQTLSDPDNPEIVGVLTADGLERESTDGLELYRYLRQLNPKKSDAFGYNEVVIRNIHSRIRALRVDEELQVQVTYTERKEPYRSFSYHIKLIGTFATSDAESSNLAGTELGASHTPDEDTQPPEEISPDNRSEQQVYNSEQQVHNSEQQVYKTTNTLEKLIAFTQNLQQELKQTKRDLESTVDKVEQLENEWQNFREMQELIQEVLDRLTRLETMDSRIQYLEADRQRLQDLQQLLRKFFAALNQQTKTLLQEHEDQTPIQ
ncbi:MAG: hypothetical protein OXI63_13970 [Candidatus Poribacteria bacterium]|nr:hypothetical protein [Candidatus Poribacteria bacterium]